MNWETTYWDIGVSSLLQTATELQLIVRLFSVRTPALQLGFGGRKFRLWLEVTLFLLLVRINIYIHILIHLNHLARAWEKAATVGPGGAGAERRFWCWKVCSFYPTVCEGDWILGSCVSSQRLSDQATSSSFPSWSASSSPFSALYCHGDRVLSASSLLGSLVVLHEWSHFILTRTPRRKHPWINWWVREIKWLATATVKFIWPRNSDPSLPPGWLWMFMRRK